MTAEPWQPWSRDGSRPATPGLERVVGHRGAKARAPENTLASIREAHRLGCRWVEFDVMLSRDGVPVLIHDEKVDRTTDGAGRVPDLALADLRRLDAGVRFGPRFAGERIPTLEEALALCLELGLAANVEIKPARRFERATGEAVARMLRELWPSSGPRLLVSSFERASLAAALDLAPSFPRGLLSSRTPRDLEMALAALACTTLHLDQRLIGRRGLANLGARGIPVLLYTVNDPRRARELLEAGAAAVFTDEPESVLAALGR